MILPIFLLKSKDHNLKTLIIAGHINPSTAIVQKKIVTDTACRVQQQLITEIWGMGIKESGWGGVGFCLMN